MSITQTKLMLMLSSVKPTIEADTSYHWGCHWLILYDICSFFLLLLMFVTCDGLLWLVGLSTFCVKAGHDRMWSWLTNGWMCFCMLLGGTPGPSYMSRCVLPLTCPQFAILVLTQSSPESSLKLRASMFMWWVSRWKDLPLSQNITDQWRVNKCYVHKLQQV